MFVSLGKKTLSCLVTTALVSTLFSPLAIAQEAGAKKNVLTLVSQFKPKWERNFNPFLAQERVPTTMQFIYEPLIVFNDLKGGTAEYRLATNHQFASDLKSISFDIRDGVKWSDGKSFTADDVVFSLQLAMKGGQLDPQGLAKSITAVEKVGLSEVKISLANIDTNIANKIVRAPIVAKHIWETVDSPETFKNENPVGTGPFTTIEVFKESVYVQCRNPNYYDDKNLDVDCIKMPQIGGNEQLLAAAIKGDLDWTSAFIPDIDEVLVAKNKHYNYWFPAAGSASFILNFKSPKSTNRAAFNDINFRRAFSMALDRKAIIELAGYGYWSVNNYPDALGDQFVAWSNPQVQAKYGKYNKYNLGAAKQLLADSGYVDINGDGFVESPEGKRIKFRIMVPNGWSDFINTVQIAVEGLKEVGINATVSTPDFGIMVDKMKDARFDAAFTNYFAGPNPYRYYFTAFHSTQMDKDRFAAHHYVDSDLDALIDSFTQTADKQQQLAIMHDIQERIASNQTTIPTMSTNYNYQYNTERYTGWFNEQNPGGMPVVWPDTPERLIHILNLKPVQ